jgi:hypothetical protein
LECSEADRRTLTFWGLFPSGQANASVALGGDIESLNLRAQFGGKIRGANCNVNHILLGGVVAAKQDG